MPRKSFTPKSDFPSHFSLEVVRPRDLVVLSFEFTNLDLKTMIEDGESMAYLVPGETGSAYIAVYFQPQNIAEQAFFERDLSNPLSLDDPDKEKDDPYSPVQSRVSDWSRLVFEVPADADPIPFTLEALLEKCSQYDLSVAPTALPPERPRRTFVSESLKYLSTRIQVAAQAQLKIFTDSTVIAKPDLERISLSRAEEVSRELFTKSWQATSTLALYLPQPGDQALQRAVGTIYRRLRRKPKLGKPNNTETSIEAPFRLILSPNEYAAWVHSLTPVSSSRTKRTELWHTRLAVRLSGVISEKEETFRTVRAIWTRDADFQKDDWGHGPDHSHSPFRMSLDSAARHNLVHLTSNYDISYTTEAEDLAPTEKKKIIRYKPLPIAVERLMLSSLGTWMNVRGAWDPPHDALPSPVNKGGLSVEAWRHCGTMGRDHYVQVAYKGYLFPYGHRATVMSITERKFHPGTPGNTTYLRQKLLLVPRELEKFFIHTGLKTATHQSYDLQMPFSRIRIVTLITPNLDPAEESDYEYTDSTGSHRTGLSLFWPRVGSQDFQFHLIAEDFEGKQVEFTAPLLFVSTEGNLATKEAVMNIVKCDYEETGPEERRKRPLQGQSVTFADSIKPGDTTTTFETQALTFGVEIPDDPKFQQLQKVLATDDIPRCYPAVRAADILIPSITYIVGQSALLPIQYHDTYLRHGFDPAQNNGQVFAELAETASGVKHPGIPLDFKGKGDRSGGLVTPNMQITGLSRLLGPIAGDVAKVSKGEFSPEEFFKGFEAKLFGVIDLWEVVGALSGGDGNTIADQLEAVPKFITQTQTTVQAFLQDIDSFKNMLVEIGSTADMLRSNCDTLIEDIAGIVADFPNFATGLKVDKLTSDLYTFKANLGALADTLPTLSGVEAEIKRQLQSTVTSFREDLADTTSFVTKFIRALQLPQEVRVRFEWRPILRDWPKDNPIFVAHDGASLTLAVEVRAQSNFKSNPTVDIAGRFQDFSLDLIGNVESFIIIHFSKLEFFSRGGKRADINVVIRDIEFVGVLSFIEALKGIIPLDGFSDPPSLSITNDDITASYSTGLPNIAFGVFSLQNLSLSAGFTVPFIQNPLSVRFNFCERHSPFLLTVSLFGGGGFFGITLDPHGIQILEAAFEFGANLSVDFGVASGGVSVMGGIYYKIDTKAELDGYFRMGGEVDVLGLIGAAIELYLDLHYEFSSGKCVGRAALTIEVEVFMFSTSVTISCERRFAGSNGDPTFKDVMEPYPDPITGPNKPWHEYCQAFA